MLRNLAALLVGAFCLPSLVAAQGVRMAFEGALSEQRWPLRALDPGLGADWSAFEYLVLEAKTSSAQRFELTLHTQNGAWTKRIHLIPDAWVRVSIPLRYFAQSPQGSPDPTRLFRKPGASYWIDIGQGGYGSIGAVEALGLAVQDAVDRVLLDIRSIKLTKDDPGSAVLEPKPVVDQYGQWALATWPQKAVGLDQLTKAWADDEAALRPVAYNLCRFGGFIDRKARPSSFFRVEQIDGKWWFVDPDGHLFFSMGVSGVDPSVATPVEGRGDLFAALPPRELMATPGAAFYAWNLFRRYGAGWRAGWVDTTLRRMESWGFNTLAGDDPQLQESPRRKAYVANLQVGPVGTTILGLPDVFAPDFARLVDEAATRQCAPRKTDQFLLGYYIGTEPLWPNHQGELANDILLGPESATKAELRAALKGGDSYERRQAFVHRIFEKYLDVTVQAIRRHDPNHLILGVRFAGQPGDDAVQMTRACDVYSHSVYGPAPDLTLLERLQELSGRPVLISGFNIGAPGRGLAPGNAQARDLLERAAGYRYYVENAAVAPMVVGVHWSQWVDDPATGRMDGRNYNGGLVSVTDLPYGELIEAARASHRRLSDLHAGKVQPVTRQAKGF
jgi:hypothetical protein